jgi:1-acyl-sn-glycerol-3-phosphate acyltransferase
VLIDRIDRGELASSGRAVPAAADEPHPLRFVSCGRALPGHEIQVVGATGTPLDARHEGRIRFRGPSATEGYFRAAEATAATISDGWVDTGDLGYVCDGELFVTGRAKDLIIRAGRNLHPEELEAAVGKVPGVRTGRVAVFGSPAPSGTERLVVVAETDEAAEAARNEIRTAIRLLSIDLLGTPPDEISLAPRGTLLKTSSGKLRRAASRAAFESGRHDDSTGPVWWQVTRVRLAGGWNPARAAVRRLLGAARSWRAWSAVALVAPVAAAAVVAVPTVRARWIVVRAAGRALAPLAGLRWKTAHLDQLPERGSCVIVANHSSYVDAIALAVLIPRDLRFIAASELFDHRVLGSLLRRLGVVEVDRNDRVRGVDLADQMIELARGGDAVVVFPEGRLSAAPGVQPFHLGAFVVAASAPCPVVPVALRGARSVLAPRSRRICPGTIELDVGPPIAPDGDGWPEAVRLRTAARDWLEARCEVSG